MGDTLSEPQTMQVLLQELGVLDAAILREDASMISGANAQRTTHNAQRPTHNAPPRCCAPGASTP